MNNDSGVEYTVVMDAAAMKATVRFFISVGHIDKINPGAIVRLVCDQTGITSKMIGDIDMKREFSFFDVEAAAADKVRRNLKNAVLDGRPVSIKEAFDGPRKGGA